MTANAAPNIAKLLENSVLASPPDLLFKIINSLDSELSSHQIGQIIGHDQSISAQVLKLSNSSFFGFKGSIKTLDRAINILGTKTVRNIAVTTLLFAHTNKVRLWNLDIMGFWLHTFLVADITREISQKVGLDGDESYIAGLLHDLGKLILYAQRQEKNELFSNVHTMQDILEYERKTWGVDSPELSKMLLEKWNIPKDIVEAIYEHKSPRGTSTLGKIVHLANEFGSVITDVHYKSTLTYPVYKKILSDIKISEEQFCKLTGIFPTIAERGKLIMKIMAAKSATPAIRSRSINMVTLVTPCEYSLAKAQLELLGFKVTQVHPDQIKAFEEAKCQEEERQRKLMSGEALEEPKVKKDMAASQEKGAIKKATGFLSKLFGKKMELKEEPYDEEDAMNPLSFKWEPIVVFEETEPVKINKAHVTTFSIFRDPSSIRENPIPFFFSDVDINIR
ncbi:MAG: hypothetical protein A2X49_16895 [Lentisphaerae bacterium GWF2_52_8]|nr:MAG: hypothetical protein A2X49_16895 [Lentisphaerae bacterium GWF2_52_8]